MTSVSKVPLVGSKNPQLSHISDPLSFLQHLLCSLDLLEKTASKRLLAPGVSILSKSLMSTQIDEQVR